MTDVTWQIRYGDLTTGGRAVARIVGGRTVRGRSDPSNQVRAGYVSVDQLEFDDSLDRGTLPLGTPVQVTAFVPDASAPTTHVVWTGQLTDRSRKLVRRGGLGHVVMVGLTAAGSLGIAPRRPARSGGYPSQLDGVRVRAALADAFARSWELATREWEELTAGTSWEEWDPQLAESDLPDGTVTLAADTDAEDPYQVVRKAAADAGAVLYELADGRLRYQTAVDRGTAVTADSPTVLPDPSALDLLSEVRLSDAATDVRVGYVGGQATADDLATARAYGRVLVYELSTSLTSGTDAQDRADAILSYRRNPRPAVTLTWPLAALSPDTVDALVQIEVGEYVELPELPGIDHDRLGFVEQLELTIGRQSPTLTMVVSSVAAHLVTVSWLALPGAWQDTDGTWNTIT